MANPHVIDLAAFRAGYPTFANVALWPDAYLQASFDTAVLFLGAWDTCGLEGDRRQTMLYLLTAHLLQTNGPALAPAGSGAGVGAITSATIDKVTVQRQAPPTKGALSFFLSGTPWGVQLWALLRQRVAGGFYAIGRPEQAAFRRGPAIPLRRF